LIKIKEKGGGGIRTRNDAILNKKRLKRNKKGGKEGKAIQGKETGKDETRRPKKIYIYIKKSSQIMA